MDQKNIETESSGLRLVAKQVGDQVILVTAKEHLLQAAVEGKYHGTGRMDEAHKRSTGTYGLRA